ncbi:hypothetical protein PBRA_008757 [Plasmodiophora brassicae]|uniref:Rab-GAP TBC domain-containing protein n=1 Tax=Plasmodiophora brassicae TaxID=37360 RepID=A0A0G4J2N5_PLABS|nr:hypothetical protein PBRA_008757 [Plasmodiophora brassicae]
MRIRGSRSYSGIVTDVGRVTAIVGRSAEAVPSELRLPVWCVVLGVYPERRELWSFMNDQIRERWTDLEEAERILGSGASPIPGVLGGVIEFAYQSLGETHVPLRPVVVDILVQMFPGPEHTAFVYAIYREHVRRMMRIDPGRVVTRTRSIIGKRDPDLDRHLAALWPAGSELAGMITSWCESYFRSARIKGSMLTIWERVILLSSEQCLASMCASILCCSRERLLSSRTGRDPLPNDVLPSKATALSAEVVFARALEFLNDGSQAA